MKSAFVTELDGLLVPVIDAGRAPGMRAYMRDQFNYLGIGTPQRRAAAKPLLKTLKGIGARQLLEHARELWRLPEREYQYIALDLLALHWKELKPDDIAALLALAQVKSWWDTVDALAGIIGDVLRHGHEFMDDALKHENMWVRRIAILHQLGVQSRLFINPFYK